MTVDELKDRLDDLSWDKQFDFEISERYPGASKAGEIENKVRELARQLTPALLDSLEQEKGYLVWTLRLSPYVPGDNAAKRAQRFLHDGDSDVRYQATRILQKHTP